MIRILNRLALGLAFGLFATISANAETVTLSTRTFWLGEQPSSLQSSAPFVSLREIEWINALVQADPILRGSVPHLRLATRPMSEIIRDVGSMVPLTEDRLDPRYDVPGYLIFGGPAPPEDPSWKPMDLLYLPEDPGDGFRVSCGINTDRKWILLCVVRATYPPDDRISLMARLYFPADPAETPTRFRDVAERLRDLAYCLDVTDELVDVRQERTTLTDCRPDQTF